MAEEINSIRQYMKEVNEQTLLTFDEEKQLYQEIMKGNSLAKKKLIESNLRLVISIAKHYQNCGLSFEDLIQEGNIGLMKAADKFNPKMGYRFSTFAPWWIRQTIGRAIADQGRNIRLPVHITENINKIKRVERELLIKFKKEPGEEEIASAANLTVEEVRIAKSLFNDTSSLDIPIGEDNDGTIGDFIADTHFDNPENNLIKDENKNAINEVLDTLTQREGDILRKRFGINAEKTMTLEEVGKDYGLTKERIRQIEKKALNKMRAPARKKFLEESFNF